jgi:hypothetical protein
VSNVAVATVAWVGFLAHLAVGLMVRRRLVDPALLPLLNLATAALVLAYWVHRWYGYVSRGTTWYATDQLLPLYAVVVCVLAAMAMWGRGLGAMQWMFLVIDGVALLGAAMVLSMLRFDRLM